MRVAVAVPATLVAATKLLSVIPGTAALVIVAPVTVPSGSEALTVSDVAVNCGVFRGVGQFVLIGWFVVAAVTVSAIEALPVRDCVSVIVVRRLFAPAGVPADTVA